MCAPFHQNGSESVCPESINQRKIGSAAGFFFCPETFFSVNVGVTINFPQTSSGLVCLVGFQEIGSQEKNRWSQFLLDLVSQ